MAGPPASPYFFLVDENLPRQLALRLREAGHEAKHIYDVGLRGASDEQIFAYAQQHVQIILTSDAGFGNVLQYPRLSRTSDEPGVTIQTRLEAHLALS